MLSTPGYFRSWKMSHRSRERVLMILWRHFWRPPGLHSNPKIIFKWTVSSILPRNLFNFKYHIQTKSKKNFCFKSKKRKCWLYHFLRIYHFVVISYIFMSKLNMNDIFSDRILIRVRWSIVFVKLFHL